MDIFEKNGWKKKPLNSATKGPQKKRKSPNPILKKEHIWQCTRNQYHRIEKKINRPPQGGCNKCGADLIKIGEPEGYVAPKKRKPNDETNVSKVPTKKRKKNEADDLDGFIVYDDDEKQPKISKYEIDLHQNNETPTKRSTKVNCPICHKSMFEGQLNDHLDTCVEDANQGQKEKNFNADKIFDFSEEDDLIIVDRDEFNYKNDKIMNDNQQTLINFQPKKKLKKTNSVCWGQVFDDEKKLLEVDLKEVPLNSKNDKAKVKYFSMNNSGNTDEDETQEDSNDDTL